MSSPVIPIRTYVNIYAVLMILLVATTGLDYLDLGFFNAVVSLSIAVVKMVLVMLFFMHVGHSSRATWLYVGAGFIWLSIMLGLTLGDYLTRGAPSGPFR